MIVRQQDILATTVLKYLVAIVVTINVVTVLCLIYRSRYCVWFAGHVEFIRTLFYSSSTEFNNIIGVGNISTNAPTLFFFIYCFDHVQIPVIIFFYLGYAVCSWSCLFIVLIMSQLWLLFIIWIYARTLWIWFFVRARWTMLMIGVCVHVVLGSWIHEFHYYYYCT